MHVTIYTVFSPLYLDLVFALFVRCSHRYLSTVIVSSHRSHALLFPDHRWSRDVAHHPLAQLIHVMSCVCGSGTYQRCLTSNVNILVAAHVTLLVHPTPHTLFRSRTFTNVPTMSSHVTYA